MYQDPENKLHFIEQKIDRILIYLLGDVQDKTNVGALSRIKKLEEDVEKLKKWKDKAIYFLIGASFTSGWGISELLKWISK